MNQARKEGAGKKSEIKTNKDGHVSQINDYCQYLQSGVAHQSIAECFMTDVDFDRGWMVPLNQHYTEEYSPQKSLIGATHILAGPSKTGKFGYAFWKKEQVQDCKMIVINCMFQNSPYSIVSNIVEQLAEFLEKSTKKSKKTGQGIGDVEELCKKIVINNEIKLDALNEHIRSRPDLKFVIVIRNAEHLVEQKKQLILYNFFEWIKREVVAQQVGLVLITRSMNFINQLEKRVRSRMNAKHLCFFEPTDEKIVKQGIIKRLVFKMAMLQEDQSKRTFRRVVQLLERSTKVDEILRSEIKRTPKSMNYYLEVFRLIFVFVDDEKQLAEALRDLHRFEQLIQEKYEKAICHLEPFCQKDLYVFSQLDFPELIIMAYIRSLILKAKPIITFKEIIQEIKELKKVYYSTQGNSFNYSDRVFEKGLRTLNKMNFVHIIHRADFENAEILSNFSPDQIKVAIEIRTDLPTYVENILNS